MDLVVVDTAADEAGWLAVHNAAVAARRWSLSGLRNLIGQSSDHHQILALDRASPAGAALAIAREAEVTAWISVAPARRQRGIGSALWQALRSWAAGRRLETRVEMDDTVSVTFAHSRGLAVVHEEPRLVHDLSGFVPNAAPDGLRIVPLHKEPHLIDGMYGVFAQIETRVAGISPNIWHAEMLSAEQAGLQRSTVALREEAVVGYAVLLLLATRPRIASHVGTFVHRDHLRTGVGAALKGEQIAWARTAGFERLEASADPGNEAKMRLYARLGYREAPGWYVMRTSM